MKYTLLELTQNILSSLDSDEVNSISDTAEARQVAEIIRTKYFDIVSRAKLPEQMQLFSLDASGDNTYPVLMYRPDNVKRIDWVKYDKNTSGDATEPQYEYVTIIPLEQFLDFIHQFDLDETEVDSFTLNNHIYYYKNDKAPTYCTILDDDTIVFDSYDNTVDTTLQTSKTLCYGQVIPTFTMSDSFTPELDDAQFPLLLHEATSLAFVQLKQMTNEKAEQEARRQWRTLQQTKSLNRGSAMDKFANFGRWR